MHQTASIVLGPKNALRQLCNCSQFGISHELLVQIAYYSKEFISHSQSPYTVMQRDTPIPGSELLAFLYIYYIYTYFTLLN